MSSHSGGGTTPLIRPRSEVGISATRIRMQENLRAQGELPAFFREGVNPLVFSTYAIVGSAIALVIASKIYYTGRVSESKLALARFNPPLRQVLEGTWFFADHVAFWTIVSSSVAYVLRYSSPLRAIVMLGFLPVYFSMRTLWLNRDEAFYTDKRLELLYPGTDFSVLADYRQNDFLTTPRAPDAIAVVPQSPEQTRAQAGEEILRSYGVQGDDGKTTVYDVKDLQPHPAYYHKARDPRIKKRKPVL